MPGRTFIWLVPCAHLAGWQHVQTSDQREEFRNQHCGWVLNFWIKLARIAGWASQRIVLLYDRSTDTNWRSRTLAWRPKLLCSMTLLLIERPTSSISRLY